MWIGYEKTVDGGTSTAAQLPPPLIEGLLRISGCQQQQCGSSLVYPASGSDWAGVPGKRSS
jgi:hypothetical protein